MAVALSAGAAWAQKAGDTCGLPPAATADILYDADQESARTFSFSYDVEIPAQPAGIGPIDVFIPLAVSDAHQTILRRDVKASIPGREKIESQYGNKFWHGHVDRSDGTPITVVVDYIAQRQVFKQQHLASSGMRAYSPKEREELALSLGSDRRVPISDPVIDKVRAELPQTDPPPLARARAIYDYVIDHMEYKKVGSGWGNGDTFWACSARYGNCTDFHALFISLARAEGIPARFEIGFPIPEDRTSGVIDGYHCWTEFHLPGVGWFPIDASEAWKHKERRDLYFGSQPADRIQFTIGRDLQLGDGHTTGPLNYFIYPHVEVADEQLDSVKSRFRFSEIPDGEVVSKLASKGLFEK
ncbi:MAG: transglutaminase domain-containing protein, partial [candidate division NC10 bacterium]|nr:transglutaminase domain-containing protein [candidate division NC10 bacterium]